MVIPSVTIMGFSSILPFFEGATFHRKKDFWVEKGNIYLPCLHEAEPKGNMLLQ